MRACRGRPVPQATDVTCGRGHVGSPDPTPGLFAPWVEPMVSWAQPRGRRIRGLGFRPTFAKYHGQLTADRASRVKRDSNSAGPVAPETAWLQESRDTQRPRRATLETET
jgi:hypothetical protein